MNLFYSLSHELRTPLNCSISMLDFLFIELKLKQCEHLIEEYLNPAIISNKLLLNQVNDMLDTVQLENNKFKFTF